MPPGSRSGPLRRGVDAADRARVAAVLGVEVAEDSGWLPGCAGHPRHLLDHVQARVGLVSVVQGLPAGLVQADRLW